ANYCDWCKVHKGEGYKPSIDDADFLEKWIKPFEHRMYRQDGTYHFPETTALVMDKFLNPHQPGNMGTPDIAFVYESCALKNVPAGFHIFNLQPTVKMVTSGGLLHIQDRNGKERITPEQAEGAQAFLEYLHERDVQKSA